MLKTSGSTESTTRPGKGGVGVGGDGGGDGGDDGGHDDEHSPRGSGREHYRTRQLVRPGLWSSMMRLLEAGVVLVASRSKSCQKVEKASKSPKNLKGLKSCENHRFGGTFTEALVLCQRRTRASVRALTVFRALFARPRSSLDTIFESITNKAMRVELLMLYRVFPQRSQEDLRAENTRVFYQL